MSIPSFDLNTLLDNEKQLYDALVNVGFIFISNHGIPETLISKMFDESRGFFDLPTETKDKIRYNPSTNTGWLPAFVEQLNTQATVKEFKEALNFGKLNQESELPHPFSRDLVQFSQRLHDLCLKILRGYAKCLGLPVVFFDLNHRYQEPSGDTLRFLSYPPIQNQSLTRAGGHSDYGSITLLFTTRDDPGGLEVLLDDKFVPVKWQQGQILVNTGDLLEFWTNNTFRSTVHRVTVPDPSRHRYSIAFFCHPEDDCQLHPLDIKHEQRQKERLSEAYSNAAALKLDGTPQTAKEHLQMRLKKSMTLS
ncbi:iron/ascorbate family oxidoreductase [Gorgonomyces haynaldii]|nr:iron/ascorbate family oxidoreductase [Gorgonomyces haynaldii]